MARSPRPKHVYCPHCGNKPVQKTIRRSCFRCGGTMRVDRGHKNN